MSASGSSKETARTGHRLTYLELDLEASVAAVKRLRVASCAGKSRRHLSAGFVWDLGFHYLSMQTVLSFRMW